MVMVTWLIAMVMVTWWWWWHDGDGDMTDCNGDSDGDMMVMVSWLLLQWWWWWSHDSDDGVTGQSGDSLLLARVCGSQHQNRYTTTQKSMYISFRANGHTGRKGFRFRLRSWTCALPSYSNYYYSLLYSTILYSWAGILRSCLMWFRVGDCILFIVCGRRLISIEVDVRVCLHALRSLYRRDFGLYKFFNYYYYWQCCLVVTWLVPHDTAAILVHIPCAPYNHAPVYSVTTLHLKPQM